MEILTYLLIQLILLFVLIFASIGDIKERKLLPIAPLQLTFLISIPVNIQIGQTYPAIGFWMGLNAGIAILTTILCYTLNIWRSRKGKKRLIGGGDIITYAAISLIYPASILGLTAIWLPLSSIVLAALAGFIPQVEKSHGKRGIPFIVYLTISYAAGIILQTAAFYVI